MQCIEEKNLIRSREEKKVKKGKITEDTKITEGKGKVRKNYKIQDLKMITQDRNNTPLSQTCSAKQA